MSKSRGRYRAQDAGGWLSAGKVSQAVKDLSPANYAMVMATGIVSIAADSMGMERVAVALFWLNVGFFLVLWALSALRAAFFTRRFLDDMFDHQRGPGFLTVVAASCVLGSQFVILQGYYAPAFALWGVGCILWLGLTYAIFTGFSMKATKPPLDQGINGAWLLFVVAPQSIAVLSALLAARPGQQYTDEFSFLALSLWLCGGIIYVWLMAIIIYRLLFFKISPSDMAPSYWISMGAMAISTLAGAGLVVNAPGTPFLEALLSFLKGLTILYWAVGTWWIPALAIFWMWRHVYERVVLTYEPAQWSAVFPLGMYAAATFQMQRAMNLSFLKPISYCFVYIALVAWLAAFVGLVHTVVRQLAVRAER